MKIINLTEKEKKELYPPVREYADIYDFDPEDLDADCGDGRVVYDGDYYTAVSITIDLENEEFVFIGYVANWNGDPER